MQKSHKNGNRRLGTRVAVTAGTAGAVLAFAAPMASAQDPVDNSIPGAAVCPATAESCVSVVVQSGTFDNNGFNLPIGKGDMIIAAEAYPVKVSPPFFSRATTDTTVSTPSR